MFCPKIRPDINDNSSSKFIAVADIVSKNNENSTPAFVFLPANCKLSYWGSSLQIFFDISPLFLVKNHFLRKMTEFFHRLRGLRGPLSALHQCKLTAFIVSTVSTVTILWMRRKIYTAGEY